MILTVVDPRPSIKVTVSGGAQPNISVGSGRTAPTVLVTASGPQGASGPPGTPGASAPNGVSIEFLNPSASWTTEHTFPYAPTVTVMVGGREVIADVERSGTTITITHASPVTGVLHLR